MSADSITPALQQFIARYVRSVEQVEILCLLSANPAKAWTVTEVFRAIQSSEKSVGDYLQGLCEQGFLISAADGTFLFSPKTPEIIQGVTELVKAYRERRVTIIEGIYGKPSDTIQDFADAFKLRKEK